MSFSRLPPELLLMITNDDSLDQRDRASLSATCRHAHMTVSHTVYRNLVVASRIHQSDGSQDYVFVESKILNMPSNTKQNIRSLTISSIFPYYDYHEVTDFLVDMPNILHFGFTWHEESDSNSFFTLISHVLTDFLTLESLSMTLKRQIKHGVNSGYYVEKIEPPLTTFVYGGTGLHMVWDTVANEIKHVRKAATAKPYGSLICRLKKLGEFVMVSKVLFHGVYDFHGDTGQELMPIMRILEPALRELEELEFKLEISEWPRRFRTPIWKLDCLKKVRLEVMFWWNKMTIKPILWNSEGVDVREKILGAGEGDDGSYGLGKGAAVIRKRMTDQEYEDFWETTSDWNYSKQSVFHFRKWAY